MLSSRLLSFITFPSSGLGREFLSVRRRSANRYLGNVASSFTYNDNHQTIENIIFAKGKKWENYSLRKRLEA